MNEDLTPEVAMQIVEDASQCSYHPYEVKFSAEDILRVFYVEQIHGDYAESDSKTAFLLKDGRYVYAWESADSSGHG